MSVPTNPYGDIISNASLATGVNPQTLTNLIAAESSFNPNAVSSAGAQGLTQLMPGTAQDLGVTNSFDPSQSIYAGASYLSSLIKRFGSTYLGAAAYNEGPGALQNQLNSGTPLSPAVASYASQVAGGSLTETQMTPDQLSGQNTTTNPIVYGGSPAPAIASAISGLDIAGWWRSLHPSNLFAIAVGGVLFSIGGLILAGNSAAGILSKASKNPVVKTVSKVATT